MFGEEQRDLSIARPERAAAHPHDLAGAEQRVQIARVVLRDAGGEDARLEIGRGNEGALQLLDGIKERGGSALGRLDPVPCDGEAREGFLLDRRDFAA